MIKGGLIYPQLQRLGKISIGEKGEVQTSSKGNTFQTPKKLDFFTIRTHYRTDKGQLALDTDIMKRLGNQPRELKIRLPFNDLEKNFQSELRYYKGGMIYCSGDGEQAARREERVVDGKTVYGEAKPFGPCGRTCKDFQDRNCKRFGALRVILEAQQQVGGVYEYRTTSRHSIENILSGLMTIQLQTGGVLAWLPLTMRLVPQTVMTPDNKAMRAYVIQIVFSGSPQQLLETVRDILALRAPLLSEIKALEAGIPPSEDDALEAKDTQDEFYPGQSAAMLQDEQPHEPPMPDIDHPVDPDEIFRAIVATLEHHRPYTGRHQGAYTTFMPNEAMQIIRELFSVGTLRELKQLPIERLQQGYEALLAKVAPEDGDDDLEILDAELMPDEAVHVTHEETILDEEVNWADAMPLTTKSNSLESSETHESSVGDVIPEGEASSVIVEAASDVSETSGGLPPGTYIDEYGNYRNTTIATEKVITADDIPEVQVNEDGFVTPAGVALLRRRAERYGQMALLDKILGTSPGWPMASYRYAWVQVAAKKAAKVLP